MFNWITEKCSSCGNDFLMSIDEKEYFDKGYCPRCINKTVRHIRAKIVMNFYDLPEIDIETANKIVDRELKQSERRRHERIDLT